MLVANTNKRPLVFPRYLLRSLIGLARHKARNGSDRMTEDKFKRHRKSGNRRARGVVATRAQTSGRLM